VEVVTDPLSLQVEFCARGERFAFRFIFEVAQVGVGSADTQPGSGDFRRPVGVTETRHAVGALFDAEYFKSFVDRNARTTKAQHLGTPHLGFGGAKVSGFLGATKDPFVFGVRCHMRIL
jgi:hypothetical protein